MKKQLFKLVSVLVLSVLAVGCAAPGAISDYQNYTKARTDEIKAQTDARQKISVQKSKTEETRVKALKDIADKATDPATKAMAVMAIALSGKNESESAGESAALAATSTLKAPVNENLEYAKIIVPALTSVINTGAKLIMDVTQSNNDRLLVQDILILDK